MNIEREEREATEAKKSDLGANFVSFGTKKHRLRIFNKGKAPAFQISITFPEGNDSISEYDIQEKFPLEILDRGQSVELNASVYMGIKRKLAVKLFWQDEAGITYDKLVYTTL